MQRRVVFGTRSLQGLSKMNDPRNPFAAAALPAHLFDCHAICKRINA
jgi:hypothetical protein